VRSGVLKRADNVKSGRGRPKLTWNESVKRDLKECNISKDLAMDRSAWRLAINVPEPWPLFVLCPLCPFMCLSVSRLFWVLFLAYPNLLGIKGYVVVVVMIFTSIVFGYAQHWCSYKNMDDSIYFQFFVSKDEINLYYAWSYFYYWLVHKIISVPNDYILATGL
jgi:hypothetical protein